MPKGQYQRYPGIYKNRKLKTKFIEKDGITYKQCSKAKRGLCKNPKTDKDGLLPLSEFTPRPERRDGYRSDCRTCFKEIKHQYVTSKHGKNTNKKYVAKNREEILARRRRDYALNKEERLRYQAQKREEYKQKDPDRYWGKHLIKRYGISAQDYKDILTSQNETCVICNGLNMENKKIFANSKRLPVDHNHATKEIRGVTCNNCNVGLGQFDADHTAELLLKAYFYITNHENYMNSTIKLTSKGLDMVLN